MKLIIDNANIDNIRSMYEFFPMDGVTCNPTILAKEKRNPYDVLKEIRDFIEDGELHVQVVSEDSDTMVEEAYRISKELGKDTYIKIPTNKEGLRAIRSLAASGFHVTATAIYTQMQAFLAATIWVPMVCARPGRFTICSVITGFRPRFWRPALKIPGK